MTTKQPTKKPQVKSSAKEAVTDIVKKKRKRPDLTEMFSPQCPPGEISQMLSQTVTIANWNKIDTNDPDQIIDRINQYHQFCIDNDIKPDMSGMALAIGVSRKTLWAWENGYESNKPQSVRNALKKGREINEHILVMLMQTGRINPIPALFLLKNNHGYKDQQDVIITPNNPYAQGDPNNIQQIVEALPDPDDT